MFCFKDSIEANVENAEVHVQQANQQLSRAADYQVILTVLNCLITQTFKRLCVCVKSGLKRLEMLKFKMPWKTG